MIKKYLKSILVILFCTNFSFSAFSETKWIQKKEKKEKDPKIEIIKKSNDKNPPKIIIDKTIKVDSSSYEIEGKILDDSKKLFVIVDDETIEAKNGKFKIKRFSPVDEKIEIIGIDQWGNKSEKITVNVIITSKKQDVANKIEPLNPNIVSKKIDSNKLAIIIGIENYKQAPIANFANMDAKYFYEYVKIVILRSTRR